MNVLIVDDEREIIEILDFLIHDRFSLNVNTFFASSPSEAIQYLQNSTPDLCICDHNMLDEKGTKVLNHILDNNLDSKFVLCSSVTHDEASNAYPMDKVFFHIIKPDVFVGIETLAEMFQDSTNTPQSIIETYIPISLNFLYLLQKTPAEIYIKLAENKFLKCLNNDVAFTNEEKIKYHNKSISHLYYKKHHNTVTSDSLIGKSIRTIMQRQDLTLGERTSIIHSQLTEMIKFTGITPELSLVVKENIQQTTKLISENDVLHGFWKDLNLFGEFPSKLYTLHALLASVLIKKLQWNTETTLFKLTLAAFFQDITLEDMELMKLYDYSDFARQEANFKEHKIFNYLQHPLKSKDIISHLKNIAPDIDKIILEHHEMPDGSGFPRKIGATKIGPLSCTFILSGILARYILEEGAHFSLDKFIEIFERRGYNRGNFKPTFEAIKNLSSS